MLARLGVGALDVDQVVSAFRGVVDFTRARVGHEVEAVLGPDERLEWFRYVVGPEDAYIAFRIGPGEMFGYREYIPVRVDTVLVRGQLEVSLYLTMKAAGEKDWLALTMADIFAWDIDFFTEPRKGDRFSLVVEKRYVDGEWVGYGRVLGAEYVQVDGDRFEAFRYTF